MYKRHSFVKQIFAGINNVLKTSSRAVMEDNKCLKMDKVLVVTKLSRYEFERLKHKDLSAADLEKKLRACGMEFESLLYYHEVHKKFEANFLEVLKKIGCEFKFVTKLNYTEDLVRWADVIIPVGGDGTFLLGASKVMDNKKPVIGFNSDPKRSEGHLCLPKEYSSNIESAICRLKQGKFDWLYRNRIRTKLVKFSGEIVCKSLHDVDVFSKRTVRPALETGSQILPMLALNEVFIGESFSARVSNLKIRLDGETTETFVKCSGVIVSTGTGSTSWYMSANRMSIQDSSDLLKLLDINPTGGENSLATILSRIYNKNLLFPPDDFRLAYTIRDKIVSFVWPKPRGIKTRDFVKKMEIKSNCYDACLVIDGNVSFEFNDGTIAVFEINPDDSLKTVIFNKLDDDNR